LGLHAHPDTGVPSAQQEADASAQKMESLRVEADESHAKAEELSAKVKTLEQQNLQQEQEISSLQHKNGLLEAETEKLEGSVKEQKDLASEGTHHSTQNETLTRRVQLLEDEAETADKSLREANEKSAPVP
jgi:tropomyosin